MNAIDQALATETGVIVGGTPIRLEGPSKLAAMYPDDPKFAAELVDDATPATRQSLERDLMNQANLSLAQAREHVEEFKHRLPRLFVQFFPGFAAVALKAAREHPEVFGLAAA